MTAAELDELLSTPRAETLAALERCPGDVIVLGAGGKMGPTVARMAARATARRVIAVSRWSVPANARALRDVGVETIACDLLDRDAVARLPDVPNVVFMAGQKFGTTNAAAATWGMNTLVPALCADRFRDSRIVAFSTGNVYALAPVASEGSREEDPLAPLGEYAASCVGRERMFELYADRFGVRVAVVRLNYAVDLRYGVLVDIALRVRQGDAVPLDMGFVNVIWQGDAARIALECLPLASAPPFVINVTGTAKVSVRAAGEWFADRFGVAPRFVGTEGADALLSDTSKMNATFAALEMNTSRLFELVAEWIEGGGQTLGKPTRFETRDGKF